jgi:hypothetical protein
MGSLEEARQQIMRELRYQSSLDLDEATYAAIRCACVEGGGVQEGGRTCSLQSVVRDRAALLRWLQAGKNSSAAVLDSWCCGVARRLFTPCPPIPFPPLNPPRPCPRSLQAPAPCTRLGARGSAAAGVPAGRVLQAGQQALLRCHQVGSSSSVPPAARLTVPPKAPPLLHVAQRLARLLKRPFPLHTNQAHRRGGHPGAEAVQPGGGSRVPHAVAPAGAPPARCRHPHRCADGPGLQVGRAGGAAWEGKPWGQVEKLPILSLSAALCFEACSKQTTRRTGQLGTLQLVCWGVP